MAVNKDKKELGELHEREIELIWRIRNEFRFGTIEVTTRDGLPEYILKTVNRSRL